jgi:hypothetical protein
MDSRGRDRRGCHVRQGALYAVYLFGRRVTAWRGHSDAIEDAIEQGHASRDERGQLYFWVGAELRRDA